MLYVILWLVLAIHNNVFNELQIYQSTYYKTILIVIEVLTIVYEYILNNFSILHFGQLYYRWTNHLRTWSNTVHSMHFIVDFVCMHVCMWFFPLHSVQSLSSGMYVVVISISTPVNNVKDFSLFCEFVWCNLVLKSWANHVLKIMPKHSAIHLQYINA